MPASDISLMKGFIRQESLVQSRYRQTLGLAVVILTVSIWGTWYFEVPLTFQTSSPTICFPIFGGALGLAALGNGLFDYWRQRKIGLPVFDYVPTHAGGHLRGAVLLDRNIETKGDFKVKLKCFQYTIDAQGERSRSPSLRWTGEAVQPKEHVLSKKRLEVSFQLPPRKVLVTSPGNIFWKLEVRAPMTGINFFAAFSLRGTN